MKTVKVTRNVWGNLVGFLGAQRDFETGEEFDAKEWLARKIDAGHPLSPKSDITAADIVAHRAPMAAR